MIISPGNHHTATVIWLHGLGADGNDFAPVVPEFQTSLATGVKFVFPHAPKRPISINGGMVMRGWYDVRAMDLTMQEDSEGIQESNELLVELIGQETEQLDSRRILLAGFSQGGAVILHTGLRYSQPLCGLLALSAYLPLAGRLDGEKHAANLETPILMMHGSYDPVIPISTAERSYQLLQAQGYAVDWQQYMMPHAVCPQQIDYIGKWLQERLAA
ncbi:MAG: alpha/beta hydrolase [Thiotrichales bacterium]|nr:alpha/beta hydrolase [Thiotrichales bacterium]